MENFIYQSLTEFKQLKVALVVLLHNYKFSAHLPKLLRNICLMEATGLPNTITLFLFTTD